MKVGLLLNKDIENLPSIKNKYKIKRNKLNVKTREIEQELLFKKCQKFFKEMNIKKSNNIKNNNNILFPPRNNIPKKLKTTIGLPFINIPNLKLDNINLNTRNNQVNFSQRKSKAAVSSTNIKNLSQKKKINLKSNSSIKIRKSKNIFNERINKRLSMYEKTLIKLRKPIFLTKFEYDENTNNINIIV